MSLDDYTYTDQHSKLRVKSKAGYVAVTDLSGNGRFVELDKQERRELALTLLSADYDARFYPGPNGTRRIDLVEKQKPVRIPKVGEFYRIPGQPYMAEPWRDSPIAKVIEVKSPVHLTLETLAGERTGWSDIRALGEPLNVAVQTEWVVED